MTLDPVFDQYFYQDSIDQHNLIPDSRYIKKMEPTPTQTSNSSKKRFIKDEIYNSAKRGRGAVFLWRFRKEAMFDLPGFRKMNLNEMILDLLHFLFSVDAEKQFMVYVYDDQDEEQKDNDNVKVTKKTKKTKTSTPTPTPTNSSTKWEDAEHLEYIEMSVKISRDLGMVDDAKELIQHLALQKANGDLTKRNKILYVCERIALDKWKSTDIVSLEPPTKSADTTRVT